MASITGLSATVSTSKDKIFLTKAILTCSFSYRNINSGNIDSDPSKPTEAPVDPDETVATVGKKYGEITLSSSWTFNGSKVSPINGNDFIISGLTQKSKNSITCKLTISATQKCESISQKWKASPAQTRGAVGEYEWIKDGDPDSTESNVSLDFSNSENEITKDIDVWTRPGTFSDYNFTANTIIESSAGLTKTKVDNWIAHCNAFNNWYNQPSIAANESNIGATCAISAGDLITAKWYNACVDACADATKKPAKVTGGPTGTIITPSVFSNLGAAISKDDS